jgi:hypothetical protein
MSFNGIYGKGKTPKEALVYAKVNEIGHGSKPLFLKKTSVKYLGNHLNLDTLLFMTYNTPNLNRDLTDCEANSKKKMIELYGTTELNKIYAIYMNPDGKEVLCFMINKSNDYNLYKFLY